MDMLPAFRDSRTVSLSTPFRLITPGSVSPPLLPRPYSFIGPREIVGPA